MILKFCDQIYSAEFSAQTCVAFNMKCCCHIIAESKKSQAAILKKNNFLRLDFKKFSFFLFYKIAKEITRDVIFVLLGNFK